MEQLKSLPRQHFPEQPPVTWEFCPIEITSSSQQANPEEDPTMFEALKSDQSNKIVSFENVHFCSSSSVWYSSEHFLYKKQQAQCGSALIRRPCLCWCAVDSSSDLLSLPVTSWTSRSGWLHLQEEEEVVRQGRREPQLFFSYLMFTLFYLFFFSSLSFKSNSNPDTSSQQKEGGMQTVGCLPFCHRAQNWFSF